MEREKLPIHAVTQEYLPALGKDRFEEFKQLILSAMEERGTKRIPDYGGMPDRISFGSVEGPHSLFDPNYDECLQYFGPSQNPEDESVIPLTIRTRTGELPGTVDVPRRLLRPKPSTVSTARMLFRQTMAKLMNALGISEDEDNDDTNPFSHIFPGSKPKK